MSVCHQPLNRKQRRSMKHTGNNHNSSAPEAVEATEDNGWDDLQKLYMECRALSVVPAQVLPLLKDPEQLKRVENPQALIDQTKVLSKDVAQYNERLQEIHNKHAGRTGSSKDGDELIEILNIGEEYQSWLAGYQTVVTPVVGQIMNQFAGEDVTEGEYIPVGDQ